MGRAPLSVSTGFPAASQAPTITAALEVIASESRCSRIGCTFAKNFS